MTVTLLDVENRNYTYCQTFFHSARGPEYFLVGTPFKRAAEVRADRWARQQFGDDVSRICLYPRNYIVRARQLVAEGKVEQFDEPSRSALATLIS